MKDGYVYNVDCETNTGTVRDCSVAIVRAYYDGKDHRNKCLAGRLYYEGEAQENFILRIDNREFLCFAIDDCARITTLKTGTNRFIGNI